MPIRHQGGMSRRWRPGELSGLRDSHLGESNTKIVFKSIGQNKLT